LFFNILFKSSILSNREIIDINRKAVPLAIKWR
jgi:hypothetical protein